MPPFMVMEGTNIKKQISIAQHVNKAILIIIDASNALDNRNDNRNELNSREL